MPKPFTNLLLACCLLSIPVLFGACIKDDCEGVQKFRYYSPVFKLKSEIRASIRSGEPTDVIRPGKIYLYGKYMFLNDIDRGIHVFDNSNPSSPRNIAWIDIPGNMDMAIKGNTLYADLYSELVSIDITDPTNVKLLGFEENLFPERYWAAALIAGHEGQAVVDWTSVDTVMKVDCRVERDDDMIVFMDAGFVASSFSNNSSQSASVSPHGIGGSMARFTIAKDWLYTVMSTSLKSVDISNPSNPRPSNSISLGWGAETIYPFRDELFIGTQTGMFRYDISNPSLPVKAGSFAHVRSCDPVVADDDHAFVTLRSGNACQGFVNQLDVIGLNNVLPGNELPLLATHQMVNPHGLGIDGDLLFICDGEAGLKVFNASNVNSLVQLSVTGMDAYDVILYDKRAIVIAKDGLYQFSYSAAGSLQQLSRIPITVTK
ncbi:MAG: hypothetical protein EOO09_11980 [Chitinophagaceae bacterium]|nr:MAG: hypothetical protein EOO09_11980 [Chitinophagaceae bacterium]